MPLPDNNTPWPPPAVADQLRDMRIDDAWYSGDKTKLRKVYAREGLDGATQERDDRGRPWRFWERPRRMGQRDHRLHVPLPEDIAATSADLLFSEPPTYRLDGDTTAQDRLNDILEAGGFANTLLEAAEVAAALGGVALRVTWNEDVAKRPLLTAVHADGVVPDYTMGVLSSVTLWREIAREGGTVVRHLEKHELGRILHAVYEGGQDNLGRRVPLTDYDATEKIADSLTGDDEIATGIKLLTAAYVPNMLPNRKWRGSMLGRSDWQSDGVRDHFMSLDETYTSWMRDLRLAKARLIVPQGALSSEGPGQGVSFDDREVWSELNFSPTSGEGITMNQFAIRVAEHEQTWKALSRKAVESAGYAAQTFGLGDTTAITATEVVSQERRSMITRDRKGRYWAPALAGILEAALQLDNKMGWSTVNPGRPQIRFGDSVSEDPKTTAESLYLLEQAKAASTEVKVRVLHPDWEDEQVNAEVKLIRSEVDPPAADPFSTGAE